MPWTKPTIQESILAVYDQLPPSERKLADITLSKLSSLASYSATELAAEAQVSKATAARFFRRVGYPSFSQARRQARAEAHMASPLYALAGVDTKEQPTDALSRHLANDIRNLSETFQAQSAATLASAAQVIAKAQRVRVAGMRNGHFIALYAANLFAQLREGVEPLPTSAMTLAEDLASIEPGDVVLVVDFRRRAAMLQTIVQAARAAGASLVFLSGTGMGTLSRPGDLVVTCLTDGSSLFDSYVAAVSIVNFLGVSVAKELGKSGRVRLEAIEKLHEVLGDLR